MQVFNQLKFLPKFFLIQLFGLIISFASYSQDFSKGRWFKLFIPKEGLQKIDGNWFIQHNIQLSSLNTEKIAIYSEQNSNQVDGISPIDPKNLKNLKKTPVLQIGLEDKIFNAEDKLFFAIKTFESIYSDSTFCYVQLDEAISNWASAEKSTASGNSTNFAYEKLTWKEEKFNFLQSGQLWISEPFYKGEQKKINFPLKDFVPNEKNILKVDLFASSIYPSQISITTNLGNITQTFEPISGERYDKKAEKKSVVQSGRASNSIANFETTFQFDSKAGSGNIGKVNFWYPKKLTGIENNTWYEFHDFNPNLKLENTNNNTQIWSLQKDGFHYWGNGNSIIKISGDSTSLVLASNSENAAEPKFLNKLENFTTDLATGTELLILCPKEFENAAKNLASYKIEKGIKTEIRIPENIYTAFSAGKLDPNAIRNYIFEQKKIKKSQLKYLLLFSDASVDVKEKNILSKNDLSISKIPSFESTESLYPLNSYVSDDFYGILTDSLGHWDQDFNTFSPMEIGIGRIPAKSIAEAEMMVNKLIEGQKHPNHQLTFVADDEDSNIHIIDSESFAKKISDNMPEIPIQKLYIDEFPMKQSNGIYTSPEANKKLVDLFYKDAGFIHFMGHGSESGWTDEKILTINDIVSLKNKNNLPILFTATCQFAKFDNPYILSGAEALLCSDTGGSQAIIGTSRPVFQSNNFTFGNNFYELAAQHKSEKNYRIGDLVKDTKNAGKGQIGNRNIVLLGDPSSSVPWNYQKLTIDKTDFTLGKANEIIIHNSLNSEITGNLRVSLSNIPTQTLGTKSPKFNFLQSGNDLLIKEISLKPGSNKINIPAFTLQELVSEEITIQFSKSNNSNENYLGTMKFPIKKGIQNVIDKEGPNIVQSKFNDNFFTISDSSGIGQILATNQKSYVTINDSLQYPIDTFVKDFKQLNQWSVEIDESILSAGENKIIFNVSDLLQNETKKDFRITYDKSFENPLKVYPNPYLDQFTIQLKSVNLWTNYPYKLIIYDVIGNQVEEINGRFLDGNEVVRPQNLRPKQIYFYKIEILEPVNRFTKSYFGKIFPIN